MKFWICPKDSQVVIYDATISGIDCTAIPTNVYLIQWHGEDGDRLLKHSGTLPVREQFYDPSQYIVYINRWILAAQNEVPPITLAQAKKIKQDFLETLFNLKRQQNIAAAGTVWNATDTYTQMITGQALAGTDFGAGSGMASLADQIAALSAQITTLANQILALQYYANLNAGILNAGAYRNNINAAIDSVDVAIANSGGGEAGPIVSTATVTYTPMVDQALYIVPDLGPVVQEVLTTLQAMSANPMASSPALDAVSAISARTATLYNIWGTKFNEIQNLTTVPQVAAYDVTSGW